MSMNDRGPDGDQRIRESRTDLGETVAGKAARKLRAREEGDRGIWFGIGTMGLVGWAVAVPTVLGIALGLWIDARSVGPEGVSWTLTGLVVGVCVGCLNAWYWIRKEMEGR